MVRCPRHYCCGDVLISHQDISLGLLVVCCSRALLLWWCAVLTPGHVLIGVVGGVLSKATTVVLVSCSHTRTLFDWSCWWCVVQGHYCCGDVLFSPPGHFLFGTAGGGLSQATTVVIGVLFSPPGHFEWGCWWWVVQGHYCCGGVLFLPPGHVLLGAAGGGLPQGHYCFGGVLFSPPRH